MLMRGSKILEKQKCLIRRKIMINNTKRLKISKMQEKKVILHKRKQSMGKSSTISNAQKGRGQSLKCIHGSGD